MSNAVSFTLPSLNNPQLNALNSPNKARLRLGLRSRVVASCIERKRFLGTRFRPIGSDRIRLLPCRRSHWGCMIRRWTRTRAGLGSWRGCQARAAAKRCVAGWVGFGLVFGGCGDGRAGNVGADDAQRCMRMRSQHWRWCRYSCGPASCLLPGGTFCSLFLFNLQNIFREKRKRVAGRGFDPH
ncbi:Glutamate synthase [NADH], amyloplastic [Glycine soja]|uniref:Glutamate synthase [NADH], amyloplastic n=1 Tax=Glycine soja TaxID=3848 RepID=A0A0B2SRX0_GLYSO|nr:Glutamate synthase [NADH], amyloplastic [Glycine soja]